MARVSGSDLAIRASSLRQGRSRNGCRYLEPRHRHHGLRQVPYGPKAEAYRPAESDQRRDSAQESTAAPGADDDERGRHSGLFPGFRVPYAFKVPDAARAADDPAGTLGPGLLTQPWQMNWWMGCWDADALCGYMLGSLHTG